MRIVSRTAQATSSMVACLALILMLPGIVERAASISLHGSAYDHRVHHSRQEQAHYVGGDDVVGALSPVSEPDMGDSLLLETETETRARSRQQQQLGVETVTPKGCGTAKGNKGFFCQLNEPSLDGSPLKNGDFGYSSADPASLGCLTTGSNKLYVPNPSKLASCNESSVLLYTTTSTCTLDNANKILWDPALADVPFDEVKTPIGCEATNCRVCTAVNVEYLPMTTSDKSPQPAAVCGDPVPRVRALPLSRCPDNDNRFGWRGTDTTTWGVSASAGTASTTPYLFSPVGTVAQRTLPFSAGALAFIQGPGEIFQDMFDMLPDRAYRLTWWSTNAMVESRTRLAVVMDKTNGASDGRPVYSGIQGRDPDQDQNDNWQFHSVVFVATKVRHKISFVTLNVAEAIAPIIPPTTIISYIALSLMPNQLTLLSNMDNSVTREARPTQDLCASIDTNAVSAWILGTYEFTTVVVVPAMCDVADPLQYFVWVDGQYLMHATTSRIIDVLDDPVCTPSCENRVQLSMATLARGNQTMSAAGVVSISRWRPDLGALQKLYMDTNTEKFLWVGPPFAGFRFIPVLSMFVRTLGGQHRVYIDGFPATPEYVKEVFDTPTRYLLPRNVTIIAVQESHEKYNLAQHGMTITLSNGMRSSPTSGWRCRNTTDDVLPPTVLGLNADLNKLWPIALRLPNVTYLSSGMLPDAERIFVNQDLQTININLRYTGVCALRVTPVVCESQLGGSWALVRHVPPGTTWHPSNDLLTGSDSYGFYTDETAIEPFSMGFEFLDFGQLLIKNGEKYIVTSASIRSRLGTALTLDATASSASPTSATKYPYYRALAEELAGNGQYMTRMVVAVTDSEHPRPLPSDYLDDQVVYAERAMNGLFGLLGESTNTRGANVYIKSATLCPQRVATSIEHGETIFLSMNGSMVDCGGPLNLGLGTPCTLSTVVVNGQSFVSPAGGLLRYSENRLMGSAMIIYKADPNPDPGSIKAGDTVWIQNKASRAHYLNCRAGSSCAMLQSGFPGYFFPALDDFTDRTSSAQEIGSVFNIYQLGVKIGDEITLGLGGIFLAVNTTSRPVDGLGWLQCLPGQSCSPRPSDGSCRLSGRPTPDELQLAWMSCLGVGRVFSLYRSYARYEQTVLPAQSNLVAWLPADDNTYGVLSGNLLANYLDNSGHGHDAAAPVTTAPPTYQINNNKKFIMMKSVGDTAITSAYYSLDSGAPMLAEGSTISVYLAIRVTGAVPAPVTGSTRVVFGVYGTGSRRILEVAFHKSLDVYVGSNTVFSVFPTTDENFHVFHIEYDYGGGSVGNITITKDGAEREFRTTPTHIDPDDTDPPRPQRISIGCGYGAGSCCADPTNPSCGVRRDIRFVGHPSGIPSQRQDDGACCAVCLADRTCNAWSYNAGGQCQRFATTAGQVSLDGQQGIKAAGTRWNPINYWEGDLAELVLYNRVLSPAENERVTAFLRCKHGLVGCGECYTLPDQSDYRGAISLPICIPWSAVPAVVNLFPSALKRHALGLDGTECRNPTPPETQRIYCYSSPTNQENCNQPVAPVSSCPGRNDGVYSAWSSCDKSCGGGVQFRTCNNPTPLNGGRPCLGEDLARCNEQRCATNAAWSAWGECSKPCMANANSDVGVRTRKCINQVTHVDTPGDCPGADFKPCVARLCMTDGAWSPWGPCAANCTTETAIDVGVPPTQTRLCTNPPPANGGAYCEPQGGGTQDCNTQFCPVDGNYTDFGSCSLPCGGGFKQRNCTNPKPRHGGKTCAGPDKEPCNTHYCPINGGWSNYTECASWCGKSPPVRRYRFCNNPMPNYGGISCLNVTVDNPNEAEVEVNSTDCIGLRECPIDGGWTNYTECSATCGMGIMTRSCTAPAPQFDGKPCLGGNEVVPCKVAECPINGEWSNWTRCSKECDGGEQRRTCLHQEHGGSVGCVGVNVEPCNATICGRPGAWSAWSGCSSHCGKACFDHTDCHGKFTRKRFRYCNNPTFVPGALHAKTGCNMSEGGTGLLLPPSEVPREYNICNPVNASCDGEWFWSDWGPCGGRGCSVDPVQVNNQPHMRNRTCQWRHVVDVMDSTIERPPMANADCCVPDGAGGTRCGEDFSEEICGRHPCAIDGTIGDYGECSEKCGGGVHVRNCSGMQWGGTDCPNDVRVDECNTDACPSDSLWHAELTSNTTRWRHSKTSLEFDINYYLMLWRIPPLLWLVNLGGAGGFGSEEWNGLPTPLSPTNFAVVELAQTDSDTGETKYVVVDNEGTLRITTIIGANREYGDLKQHQWIQCVMEPIAVGGPSRLISASGYVLRVRRNPFAIFVANDDACQDVWSACQPNGLQTRVCTFVRADCTGIVASRRCIYNDPYKCPTDTVHDVATQTCRDSANQLVAGNEHFDQHLPMFEAVMNSYYSANHVFGTTNYPVTQNLVHMAYVPDDPVAAVEVVEGDSLFDGVYLDSGAEYGAFTAPGRTGGFYLSLFDDAPSSTFTRYPLHQWLSVRFHGFNMGYLEFWKMELCHDTCFKKCHATSYSIVQDIGTPGGNWFEFKFAPAEAVRLHSGIHFYVNSDFAARFHATEIELKVLNSIQDRVDQCLYPYSWCLHGGACTLVDAECTLPPNNLPTSSCDAFMPNKAFGGQSCQYPNCTCTYPWTGDRCETFVSDTCAATSGYEPTTNGSYLCTGGGGCAAGLCSHLSEYMGCSEHGCVCSGVAVVQDGMTCGLDDRTYSNPFSLPHFLQRLHHDDQQREQHEHEFRLQQQQQQQQRREREEREERARHQAEAHQQSQAHAHGQDHHDAHSPSHGGDGTPPTLKSSHAAYAAHDPHLHSPGSSPHTSSVSAYSVHEDEAPLSREQLRFRNPKQHDRPDHRDDHHDTLSPHHPALAVPQHSPSPSSPPHHTADEPARFAHDRKNPKEVHAHTHAHAASLAPEQHSVAPVPDTTASSPATHASHDQHDLEGPPRLAKRPHDQRRASDPMNTEPRAHAPQLHATEPNPRHAASPVKGHSQSILRPQTEDSEDDEHPQHLVLGVVDSSERAPAVAILTPPPPMFSVSHLPPSAHSDSSLSSLSLTSTGCRLVLSPTFRSDVFVYTVAWPRDSKSCSANFQIVATQDGSSWSITSSPASLGVPAHAHQFTLSLSSSQLPIRLDIVVSSLAGLQSTYTVHVGSW